MSSLFLDATLQHYIVLPSVHGVVTAEDRGTQWSEGGGGSVSRENVQVRNSWMFANFVTPFTISVAGSC